MSELRTLAAALAGQMGAPLARVELGASQLAREAATPAAAGLAEGIRQAVAELDRSLSRLLALLAPAPTAGRELPLEPVLAGLHGRLAPVLVARGIGCSTGSAAADPTVGDPDLLQAAALALLRAGAGVAGRGGSLRLSLASDSARWGVCLEAQCGGASPESRALEEACAEVRLLALAHGGACELSADEGARVTLWWPRGGAACAAF